MIAPVRTWTLKAKANKSVSPMANKPSTKAEKATTPKGLGVLAAWERLWAHQFELTFPRFED